MGRSSKPRRGFTLVELLVVIGIMAVLVGILLPVIGRARKQAITVACMATLRMVGQTLYMYASENKGSLPYGFYRSDVVATPDPNSVGESDPNTAIYVWWSVIRSYMRRSSTPDNGASNSGISTSTRGMKGMTCPEALGTDGSVSYTVNMVAMPDLPWESHPFYMSISNLALGVKPARLSQLYSDNILMWDVTGVGPTFSSQYVVGYELDSGGPGYSYGSLSDAKKAYLRYRQFADDPYYVPLTSPLRNDIPIFPGSNKEVMPGAPNGQRGNVRWRHGQNNAANFLFADGTVRTMKMTTGTPGKPDCKGEVLHKYFRLKPPPRYKPFN